MYKSHDDSPVHVIFAESVGFEPTGRVPTPNGFQDRLYRPLRQLSMTPVNILHLLSLDTGVRSKTIVGIKGTRNLHYILIRYAS
jgi:hypothetical protein